MGLHRPTDRHFFLNGGAVKTQGGSLQLAKGEFGIFDMSKVDENGAQAVSSFNGKPSDTYFELRLGTSDNPISRSSGNKSYSSFPFKLKDVIKLKVSAPETTEKKVDILTVGYNGIDDDTSIVLRKGDKHKIFVRLSGEAIGLLGYPDNYVDIEVPLDVDKCPPLKGGCSECDECEEVNEVPVILEAVKNFNNQVLRGGVPVTQFAEMSPILKCNQTPDLEEKPYKFYCLEVCDTGDQGALALVQAQYPTSKVIREDRKGSTSFYKIMQLGSKAAPSAYKQTLASIIKGCKDCPEGYDVVKGGLLYVVTLEDDGQDKKETVQGLANAVESTATKSEGQKDGVGFYTVVLSQKLSDEDFKAFIDQNKTATIEFVGKTKDICKNDTVSTISWSQCGECHVIEREYVIDLPDTECGESRLDELKMHYPQLTIEAEGTQGGCQRRYKTKTISNVVCDECDPMFKAAYETEAPEPFDGRKWTLNQPIQHGNDCKVGVMIKGKTLEVFPDECLRDDIGFIDDSVKIQASGGYISEVRFEDTTENGSFHVEYRSRWQPRTHLGGNMWQFEDRARTFFTGTAKHSDLLARMLTGEESVVNPEEQLVDYALTLRRDYYAQSFGSRSEDNITYHVLVQVGREKPLEELLNSLATSAGIKPVKALG